MLVFPTIDSGDINSKKIRDFHIRRAKRAQLFGMSNKLGLVRGRPSAFSWGFAHDFAGFALPRTLESQALR